jgi:hypothetical protein
MTSYATKMCLVPMDKAVLALSFFFTKTDKLSELKFVKLFHSCSSVFFISYLLYFVYF